MKKSILILVVLAVATAAAVRLAAPPAHQTKPVAPAAVATSAEPASAGARQAPAAAAIAVVKTNSSRLLSLTLPRVGPAPAPASEEEVAFSSAIDTVISPKSTYGERQAAWKQLLGMGRIQDAIAELQERAVNHPDEAETAAALGQAYLKACTTTDDIRSKAVWAMEADQAFDAALSADPKNWDARFTKAVAMSFWPADLNKGPEIVGDFNTLIAQQEQETPQPEFAATYDWLGRQYEKMGQPALAQQVWARGAALFPDNEALRGRLASGQ